ncbi:4'-phosphopantetheinyl transferase family protein [Christiangramia sabulilitoris]|uniref:4-phosphopantetheinyl transferase family protein n=1 Tax=Christiangramia sabulilitoris TaxID=2583991 RepID=A0A550I668_9FLAO|nr:4'-phosphopantetheinyl transferase superfamily protein [Christiangramia sabulilitoris]TRO66474.1 4-phosphopantetheinyl transferase family protein [Christiangramia sabulilitoris]
MIGNDIIDLNLARTEKKSENLRILQKICTEGEIELIKSSEDPELFFWKVWSMKETAYKAHQRLFDIPRKLNPQKYECHFNPGNKVGLVSIDGCDYNVKLSISADSIHCHTRDASIEVFTGVKNKDQILINFLASHYTKERTFDLRKNSQGIPSCYLHNLKKIIPLSVSHHGKFTAFAIPLIKS